MSSLSQVRFYMFSVLLLSVVVVFSGCAGEQAPELPEQLTADRVQQVGFDVDDTLLFSTPAFNKGFDSDHEPFSEDFWRVVNQNDSPVSCIKPRVYEIVQYYRDNGVEVYAITAREGHAGENLAEFLESTFGIPAENVYFEPDEKSNRISNLDLDVYIGDSDSDIKEGREGGAVTARVLRSPESNYDEKNNPGDYDEIILEDTTDHDCDVSSYLETSFLGRDRLPVITLDSLQKPSVLAA